MDAYQETTQPPTGSNELDQLRSKCVPAAPTYSDVAQWKAESTRFLDDVTQRLNDILTEVDQTLSVEAPAGLDSVPVSHHANVGGDKRETPADESDSGRISALKARLARKLHNFEETNERPSETRFTAEVSR